MRLTFVNTHDLVGGAERCSYDLASHLHEAGDDVSLIVGRKLGEDSFVSQLRYRYLDYKARQFLFQCLGLTDTTLMAPIAACLCHPYLKTADVYNIHNMHGFFWNIWALPLLASRAPVVLTLHDEWFLTGDCAYTYGCDRYRETCGLCPQAEISDPDDRYALGGRDNTRFNLRLKRAVTRRVATHRLTIVVPSEWMREKARRAPHLARFRTRLIPYGVDLDLFRPQDKHASRRRFDLPLDRPLVYVGAANLGDRRKNFRVLRELLTLDLLPDGCLLVLAGRVPDEAKAELAGRPVRFLGYLAEKNDVAAAFSACDVSLLLSLADNLPYAGIESLACGCPVVGSNVGGIPELVRDGETGWLIHPEGGVRELAACLRAALGSPEKLARMSVRARRDAHERFSMKRFVESHRSLFSELSERCALPS